MSNYPHIYPIGANVTDNNVDGLCGVIVTHLSYIPRQGGAQYVVLWKDELDADASYYIEVEDNISLMK